MVEKNLYLLQATVNGNSNNLLLKIMNLTTEEQQIPRNSILGNIEKVPPIYDKAFET